MQPVVESCDLPVLALPDKYVLKSAPGELISLALRCHATAGSLEVPRISPASVVPCFPRVKAEPHLVELGFELLEISVH